MQQSKPHILVVDDELFVVKSLQDLFRHDYTVSDDLNSCSIQVFATNEQHRRRQIDPPVWWVDLCYARSLPERSSTKHQTTQQTSQ